MGGTITNVAKTVLKAEVAKKGLNILGTKEDLFYPLDRDLSKGTIEFVVYSQQGVTTGGLLSGLSDLLSWGKNTKDALKDKASDIQNTLKNGIVEAAGKATKTPDCKLNVTKKATETITKGDYIPKPTGRKITMPLMQGVMVASTADYSSSDAGVSGDLAEGALQNGGNIASSVVKSIMDDTGSLLDSLKSGIKGDVATLAAFRAGSKVLNYSQGVGAGVKSAAQISINPNVKVLFNSMGLRDFQFNFTMIPTSASEAKMVESIIKAFREEQHPDYIPLDIGGRTIKAGYHFPNKFKIIFKHNGNEIPPKIDFCHLVNVNVTYNGNTLAMHSDGKYTEYQISLTFKEYRALDKSDIRDKGY